MGRGTEKGVVRGAGFKNKTFYQMIGNESRIFVFDTYHSTPYVQLFAYVLVCMEANIRLL